MNKDRVLIYASLAEIVSALAIVISLLYVVSEFRRTETLTSREVDTILFERVRYLAFQHVFFDTWETAWVDESVLQE